MAEILVIKHGALGDMVLALGAMAAIRAHHPGDRLTLLTTPPQVELVQPSGWLDAIWTERRLPFWQPGEVLELRRRVAALAPARIYDLQGSSRTAWYRRLWPVRRSAWVRDDKPAAGGHARQRLHRLLATAGIVDVPPPAVAFLDADVTGFGLPASFVLLVPSAGRVEKRWPAARWRELALALARQGLATVVVGSVDAPDLGAGLDLRGRTSLAELAAVTRLAQMAIGNDSGPMHLAAAAGCAVLTLFGGASDPQLSAPGWPAGHWLQAASLEALGVAEVTAALDSCRKAYAPSGPFPPTP